MAAEGFAAGGAGLASGAAATGPRIGLDGCAELPGAAEVAGGALERASGGIGVPKVTAGPEDAAAEGLAKEGEDGNGVVGAAASGLLLGPMTGGDASGEVAGLGRRAAALAGTPGLMFTASGPPGGSVAFALGSSTFGTVGHPSATPGG